MTRAEMIDKLATSGVVTQARLRVVAAIQKNPSGTARELADAAKVHVSIAHKVRHKLGLTQPRNYLSAEARRKQIEQLAARGYSGEQIARKLKMTVSYVRVRARQLGVTIKADAVLSSFGLTSRADDVMDRMVEDAENLIVPNQLNYNALSPARVPAWEQSLQGTRDALGRVIQRLRQQQQGESNGSQKDRQKDRQEVMEESAQHARGECRRRTTPCVDRSRLPRLSRPHRKD